MIIFEGLAFSIACGVGLGCGFGLIGNIYSYFQSKRLNIQCQKLELEVFKEEKIDMVNNLIEIDNMRLSRLFQLLSFQLTTLITVEHTIEDILMIGINLVGLLLSLILLAVLQMR